MSSSEKNALDQDVSEALQKISLLSDLPDEKLQRIVDMVQDTTTERATEALREVDLFQDLDDDDLARLRGAAVPVKVDEGEMLFEEGEPGDAFYVVIAGAIELLKGSGSSEKKLAIMRNGDTFGEMALLNANPRSASARAAEPTHLLAISRDDFEELLGGETLAVRMMRGLSKRLWATSVRFAAQSGKAVQEGEDAKAVLGDLSRVIQRRMLPSDPPSVDGFTIAADANLREDGRGSAMWDAFPLGDGRMVLAAMSVIGEGLPPAHHLAVVRALFREIGRDHRDLGTLLRRTNNALADTRIEGLTQTVECGLIALQEGGVEWASAGRARGTVARSDGTLERLPSDNAAMGGRQGFEYETHHIRLDQGESVLLLAEVPDDALVNAEQLLPLMEDPDPAAAVSKVLGTFQDADVGDAASRETTSVLVRRAPGESRMEGSSADDQAEADEDAPDDQPEAEEDAASEESASDEAVSSEDEGRVASS